MGCLRQANVLVQLVSCFHQATRSRLARFRVSVKLRQQLCLLESKVVNAQLERGSNLQAVLLMQVSEVLSSQIVRMVKVDVVA